MDSTEALTPRNHAERVAVFRHSIVGSLTSIAERDHGDLARALRERAAETYRPPESACSRHYSVATLERWFYAYQKGGLDALKPAARSDRGRGRELPDELRQLLLDIRRENPSVSVPMVLETLRLEGLIEGDTVSQATVRRLYRQEGLVRTAQNAEPSAQKTRLRWQTGAPDALWHADVCHGAPIVVDGRRTRVRIHGILDDYSRYVLALWVSSTEREQDMLDTFVKALRTYGKPDVLYVDNGATYRGEGLQVLCARLKIALKHARPYDPQARGKMERFWRTMRSQVLDHCTDVASLTELQTRLNAWLDRHYHRAPHGGLLGAAPHRKYLPEAREVERVEEEELRQALIVRDSRRVRSDTTVSIEGQTYELDRGWLAGRIIDVYWCMLDDPLKPWAEYEGKRYELHILDAVANSTRKRPPRLDPAVDAPAAKTEFNPSKTFAKDAERAATGAERSS